jgi:hypothetical protein
MAHLWRVESGVAKIAKFLSQSHTYHIALRTTRHPLWHARWKLVVGASSQRPTSAFLLNAAPLFEKEWDIRSFALFQDRDYPGFFYRPSTWAALTTDDDPMDAF